MKKAISVLAVLAVLLSMIPSIIFPAYAEELSGKCGPKVTWTYDGEETLTISGSGPMYMFTDNNRPAYLTLSKSIKKVVITEGVTTIGNSAFDGCGAITDVSVADGVTSIGTYAFRGCISLENINIPSSVVSIGYRSFQVCWALTNIIIPDSVKSIGLGAFENCKSLQSISIPDSVSNIDTAAFGYCVSLRSARLPNGITAIPESAFIDCESLTEITIPDSVTTIRSEAFRGCLSLKKISIPDSVEYIEAQAFLNCSFTSFDIPDGVKSIGRDAFGGCESLTSITIPDSVKSIGWGAFNSCKSLKSITIPDGISSLETGIFDYCSSLNEICIPNSVTSIGDYAFQACSNLENVYFGGTKRQWERITIGKYNDCLLDANVYFLGSTKKGSRYSSSTKNISIKVFEETDNKNEFRVSKGAAVSINSLESKKKNSVSLMEENKDSELLTNEHGVVNITNANYDSITIAKTGYTTRTIPMYRVRTMSKASLYKASNNPIINAVWIGNTDILEEEYAIGLVETGTVTLEAEIDWGKHTSEKVELLQKQKSVEFSGNTLTVTLKDYFDLSEPVYIQATDSQGNKTKKELKFSPGKISPMPEALDGTEVSFGEKLTFKIPEKYDLIGGKEVSVGLNDAPVPLTIVCDNGKIYVAIGVDLISYSSSDKWAKSKETKNKAHVLKRETENFIDKFKDLFDQKDAKQSFKKLKNIKTTWKNALKYPQGSFGFDADITCLGFAEGCYTANSNGILDITWIDSGVIVNPEVGIKANWPFALGPVPCYFEASLTADALGKMNLYINELSKQFTPNGEISGAVAASGGIGVGIKKVVYAGGGLEGKLTPNWEIYKNETNYFNLKATLNAYAKVGVAVFEYKHPFEPIAEKVLIEYPEMQSSLDNGGISDDFDVYNTENYAIKKLDYLDGKSTFSNNSNISLMSSKFSTTGTLKTNIYRESTPQLIELQNGNKLAVWTDSNSRDINSVQLYYSLFSGGTWSEPSPVIDDGTMDYAPYLTVIGNKAYLIWQNATTAFSGTDTLDSIAPFFDVSIGCFDETDGFTVSSIQYDGLDTIPTICGDGDSVYAVWLNNSGNNWFGDNSENSIISCSFNGSNWSEPESLYSDLNSVNDIAADYNDGLVVAYSMDTDGNIETINDVRLFENGIRVTSSDTPEEYPLFEDHTLYWNSNGSVIRAEGEVQSQVINVGRYQVLEQENKKVLVYTVSNGLYSDIYASYYNDEKSQWDEPINVTSSESFIGAFSGIVHNGTDLEVLYNSEEVTGAYTDEDPYGRSDLVMTTVAPSCNLSMGELIFNSDEYSAGNDMELGFDLTNNGSTTVSQITVNIIDESGTILSTEEISEEFVPGQTVEEAVYLSVDPNATGQKITVSVIPDSFTDYDESDNHQEAVLEFEDVDVEQISCGPTEDNKVSISADVVNRGYHTRNNIKVELHKGSLNGQLINSSTISSLDSMGLETVSFSLPKGDNDVYFIAIKDSGDEYCKENDYDFIFVPEYVEESAPEDPLITLAAHTISLTGNIGINYYFFLNDAVLADPDAEMVFSLPNGGTRSVPVSSGTKRTINGKTAYGYSCEVNSTQMTGTVTAKLVMSDGYESEEFPYTVKQYADIVIANANNNAMFTKATPLVKAMLNYGAYAQKNFQYDDSPLANADLSEEEKDVSSVTAKMLEGFVRETTGEEKGLTYSGSTLVLKSETSIRHYFTVQDGYSIDSFTFNCGGKKLVPVASGNMYYVEIPNIASGDLDTMYEVTVGGFRVKYGALTYVYNQLSKTTTSETLRKLCQAIYLYNQAANEYFK